MDTIPQDLTDAVRAAAEAAPGYRADLTDVHRRVRRRHNRQAALSVVGAVALVVATGFGVVTRHRETTPDVLPAASDTPPEPAWQRMTLNGAFGRYRMPSGGSEQTVALSNTSQMGVLEPSGRIDTVKVAGARRWDRVVALPDGGVVAMSENEFRLVVTAPNGTVRIQRNLSHDGEWVSMVTASADTAYLWRETELVAHDIATGKETGVVNMHQLGVRDLYGAFTAADVSSGLLVLAPKRAGCPVGVLARPLSAGRNPVPPEMAYVGSADCERVTGIRLSPDGAMAAVTYEVKDNNFGIVVFRIADKAVLARGGGVSIGSRDGSIVGNVRPDPRVSVAWQSPTEVRGAWYFTYGDEPFRINTFAVNW
ncbi:hypothetical protein [Actinoplanes derwentensis]|uniref:WD40-like Beta Propeller Repeat n=1 Tax=Actinoplanes derwentensis TaxID=113562 RepID=A0A1H2D6U3_9ACTN|nr:hypothetical protein [Actinoplanes derwentensis]GID85586.1 hypothetical protein Ade03nite_45100 [Actinoplanes derwentensis]SDT78277.1 hypothetical protein SAMN04489716_8305 [Actinoplanes derwentensis]